MIKQLELKNFMVHRDLTLDFDKGLTAIRGANEKGKSSIALGIMYALFGAKALRTTLDEAVTWGTPVGRLRVTLTLSIGGKDYVFLRSKAGAEVVVGGKPFVTGQNEVTNFAANLLGVDANTASKLMLASQNGLRGSLEQGAKATALLIESLSDFDLFDRLLERMQERLLLGAPALLETRVAQTEQDHANLEQVAEPDVSAWEAQAAGAVLRVAALHQALEETLLPAEAAARLRHEVAQKQRVEHQALTERLVRATGEQAEITVKLANAQAGVKPIDTAVLNTLKQTLQNASQQAEALKVHERMATLMKNYPESFWEGTRAELDAEIAVVSGKVEETTAKIAQIDADLRVWKSQKVTATTCPTCKQTIANLDLVLARNAELDDQILTGHAQHASWATYLSERRTELKDLRDVSMSAVPYEDFVKKHGDLLEVDYSNCPPEFKWKGEVPVVANNASIEARIAAIEANHTAVRQNVARAEVLGEQLLNLGAQISSLQSTLAVTPDGGAVEQLATAVIMAAGAVGQAQIDMSNSQNLVDYCGTRIKELVDEYKQFLIRQVSLVDAVAKAKADLTSLHFNNGLLKKVRAARPIIADQLWQSVLMAVSTMFSQMRGEKTVVTKDKDGFKANGQSVESLSGSSLDILGLALRVSLTRTFLPSCPFVILDEPQAACDGDRSNALLGFLAGAGFQQTIIITHDDASDAVADNLITI